MKRIAVDVDDVIFPYNVPFYNFLRKKLDLDLDPNSLSRDFLIDRGYSAEEEDRLHHEFSMSSDFYAIRPIEGAIQGLRRLRNIGEVYAVTARPMYLRGVTQSALYYHFEGIFSGVELGNSHNIFERNNERTKAEICEEIDADILIDDHPKHIAPLRGRIPAVLVHRPGNEDFKMPRVYRARDWKQITKIVQRIL